ncbi:MAG: hypothetical protein KBG20_16560 [Caldilineaceae bacterium]|nr:hypothetical protein [Caldilineaceae bacterium]MBP8108737.1 hypothetical protein [Caldilineaceae bacterium]MBP8124668.1 hypothetical protein [Caldilineaceae bacterium]MBP9073920.1 hypothetical protein [Caldilineaceae bacterium]
MMLNEWFAQQKDREDAVGALARRFMADSSGPLWANDPQTFHQYLTDRAADPDSFAALDQALSEWIRRGKRSPVLSINPAEARATKREAR